jgi:hypothetical protein
MRKVNTDCLPFCELREKEYYFIDKTLLIKDLLDRNEFGRYVFTRPHGFGKTTNLSMLDAFFNISYKDNKWFDGLEISKYREYDCYRNAFPVIKLDLGNTAADNMKSYLGKVRCAVLSSVSEHGYLKQYGGLQKYEVKLFKALVDGTTTEEDILISVKVLSEVLERYHGKKAITLVDNYDCAVIDTFGTESQRSIMNFLGEFFSTFLKGNKSCQMAYVTGIIRMSDYGTFSGVNNICDNDIFSIDSDERFGFTENEVKKILSDFGHPEKFDKVKSWYDGYTFGDTEVYNPYSVMKYIEMKFVPDSYWANSGNNVIIKWLLDKANDEEYNMLSKLINGESYEVMLSPTLAYEDVKADSKTLLSLMAMAGYLKTVRVERRIYRVSVPNYEVMEIVSDTVGNLISNGPNYFDNFLISVRNADGKGMEVSMGKILLGASYFNLRSEYSYQLVLMTLMSRFTDRYMVKTDSETGNGRADVILIPKSDAPMMIFELKKVDSEGELDGGLDEAVSQVHERKYYLGAKGKVYIIAMAFCGKIPKVRVEEINV